MSILQTQAPAKLNLSLRVLGKREDGFHEIDTLMVKLPGLVDRIEIREAADFSFECALPDLPTDESNLVVRAVRAYEAAAGVTCQVAVKLEKAIPHGAGLGGGSSDAAATLAALDEWHGSKLGSKRLIEVAAAIGSDVPFFLMPGAVRCTGRGEILAAAVPAPEPLPVLILKPAFMVPTPEAYQAWSKSTALPGVFMGPQDVDGVALFNDLEGPVFEKHRFLAEMKLWLLARNEVRAALLCGSGSAMFAVLQPGADGAALAKCARHELDPGLWHWAGKTGV